MPTDVIMPQMGESIFEGTITKWLKKAGDTVQKDEPLFEISTDKVDAEIPSPIAGVLSQIKVPEGATVQVNTVVAVLDDSDGAAHSTEQSVAQSERTASASQASAARAVVPPNAEPAPPHGHGGIEIVMPQMGESIFEGTITKWLKSVGDTVQKDEPLFEISTDKVDAEIPAPVAGVLTAIHTAAGVTVQVNTVVAVIGGIVGEAHVPEQPLAQSKGTASSSQASGELAAPQALPQVGRSSPLVRRIAKENRIDLAQVRGTGSNGRINKDDILGYLRRRGEQPPAPQAQSTAPETPSQTMSDRVEPLSRMRAIIAQRMVESKRISPHVHSVYKVDMTRIARLRERHRAAFEQRHGIKLTYMPFIAAAAVDALRRFPILNASLIEGSVHYHAHINLGIAVALEWGLIVPVVKESERQSFAALARAINDLAGRARTKKLMPHEVEGSTFTLTNAGVFGGEFGTPILNQPESAILAIGGLRKEPVVLTDAEGNDTIAIRSMQNFCLGFDHRIIDGADSGKFMSEFKKTLENWNTEIG